MSDDDVERLAAFLHERFCGCAATEREAETERWCDSIYPATADLFLPVSPDPPERTE